MAYFPSPLHRTVLAAFTACDSPLVVSSLANLLGKIPTMEDIITVLEQFAPVFSDRVWSHALIFTIILIRRADNVMPFAIAK